MASEHQGLPVSRRQFVQGAGVAGLGLLGGCGRLPWQAQQPPRVPRIGFLGGGSPTEGNYDALTRGLAALGYVEGYNIIIEGRYADGQVARLPELVAELIDLPVELLVVGGTLPLRAATDATETIPIVMAVGNEPVRQGFVASLARPGGNITGLSQINVQLAGKQLELLKDTVPRLARLAFLWNPAIPDRAYELRETETAAESLALRVHSLEARTPEELEVAFAAAATEQPDALLVQTSSLNSVHRARIAELAAGNRLPTMASRREFATNGGLMGYGPNRDDQYQRAAYFVDRILKGAKPADLPVEQPMTFDFVINLKTAQTLGLTIPSHVLAQATEIIQ
jgi:putative tryptophan/tyrosine transport system substrate-binding protein